jgi:hypothetical protein
LDANRFNAFALGVGALIETFEINVAQGRSFRSDSAERAPERPFPLNSKGKGLKFFKVGEAASTGILKEELYPRQLLTEKRCGISHQPLSTTQLL